MLSPDRLLKFASSLRRPVERGLLRDDHATAALVLALIRADHYGVIDRNDFLPLRDAMLDLAGINRARAGGANG